MPNTKRRPRASDTAVKLTELALAAPQVIAHRVTRMALAGPAPSRRDQKEFSGMVMEKQLAFAQAWVAVFGQALQWQQKVAISLLSGASAHKHAAQSRQATSRLVSAALAPVHRKATANAKRLARTKLR